jgi:uncharacterized protein (UPF0276 family)
VPLDLRSGDGRTATRLPAARIPAAAGIGLRAPHESQILAETPALAWLEVHSENYLLPKHAPRLRLLRELRHRYPISCHGVGLSLGSAEGLSATHLAALKTLFDDIEPGLVSEHLSWSVAGDVYLNDLLPIPYSEDWMGVVCRNIDTAQSAFRRRILLENPSRYLSMPGEDIGEPAFIAEIVRRTGCGLLLDVNNIVVSAINLGQTAAQELDRYPLKAVEEIHVAGHRIDPCFSASAHGPVAIDDHGSAPGDQVWALLATVIERIDIRPTLVEWDIDVPELPVLMAEADKAQLILDRAERRRQERVA